MPDLVKPFVTESVLAAYTKAVDKAGTDVLVIVQPNKNDICVYRRLEVLEDFKRQGILPEVQEAIKDPPPPDPDVGNQNFWCLVHLPEGGWAWAVVTVTLIKFTGPGGDA